jgi:hypothetical protein
MDKDKLDSIVSGVLFDFMGWLTTREDKLILSSSSDASPAVKVIDEFMTMRGINKNCEPMIKYWNIVDIN